MGIDIESVIESVSSLFDDAAIDDIDGIKFTWEDRWVHLRKSNTEPIMRIYAEAPNQDQARKLINQIKNIL